MEAQYMIIKMMGKIFDYLKKCFICGGQKVCKFHLSRKKIFILFFVSIFAVEMLFASGVFDFNQISRFLASIYPDVLIGLANDYRQAHSLAVLTVNPLLEEAAQMKAQDMAQKGYFAHTSPEGVTPWHWFEKVGYNFVFAGENLAVNFSDSQALHNAWLSSLGHKNNIVNQNFSEIGIAVAKGLYKDKEAFFVVQLFGSRKREILPILSLSGEKEAPAKPDSQKVSFSAKADSKIVLGPETAEGGNFVSYDNFQQPEETFVSLNRLEETPFPQKANYYSSFFSRIFSAPKTIAIFWAISSLIIILCLMSAKIVSNVAVKFKPLALKTFIVLMFLFCSLLFNHSFIFLLGNIFRA